MFKNILFTGLLALLLVSTICCGELEKETPEGTVLFELYEEGYKVEGLQYFTYGATREYTLHSWFVTTMKITPPEGWSANFYNGGNSGSAVIVAPEEGEGVGGGEIKVEITGPGNQIHTYVLPVAALANKFN